MLLTIIFFGLGNSNTLCKSWQLIQEESRDAVVHIVVVRKEFNWRNPYVIEPPRYASGTGFLIDQEGSIITCSHVIEDAISVFIVVPSLGKQVLKACVIGLCPEHDIALLHLDEESRMVMHKKFGRIPNVSLGDSDFVKRGESVIALGYPGTTIETHQLKGTTGVISARLNSVFQSDVALNPGNSGGPVIDENGAVIAIASSVMRNAQNSNFAIPINTAKSYLPSLYKHKLVRIPSLAIVWTYTTKQLREYLNLFDEEGCAVRTVMNDETGLQVNDVISKVNGYLVDNYGEIKVLADGDAIRFDHYISQLPLGTSVIFDIYRNGLPLQITMITNQAQELPVATKYPAYEKIEYEAFAGMIIMPLTSNYIDCAQKAIPSLQRYLTNLCSNGSRLVIAEIIPGSFVAQNKIMNWGDTINEVNGEKVSTIDDFRTALQKSIETGIVTITTTDERNLFSDNILNVLSLKDSCDETVQLSQVHGYPISETVKQLIEGIC